MTELLACNFDEASGDVVDYSGQGNGWTLNNGGTRTADGAGHGVDGADGAGRSLTKNTTGLVQVASPAYGQTTARTAMFWMKNDGNSVWWFRFYIVGDDTGSFGLYRLSGNLTLRLRKGGSNTNTAVAWTGDGDWHHFAITYDGSNGRLYIDGTLVATSATVTAPLDSADSIEVMESSLDQWMDELRIFDEALDQPTIASLMDTPPGSGPPSASGTVNLAASGALSVSGVARRSGTVTLSASAGLAGAGSKTTAGAASLAGTAALSASGVRRAAGGVLLGAAGVLTAAGAKTTRAARTLAAAAGLTPAGTSRRSGTVTLSATAALSAGSAPESPDVPPARTFAVPAESRVFTVPAETRTWEA